MAWLSRILAPVDFSPRCRGATRYAEYLARHSRGELFLLHAVAPIAPMFAAPEAMAYSTTGDWNDERIAAKQMDLVGFLDAPEAAFTLTHETVEGDPAQAIVSFAHDLGVQLIVMATHGYGPFRRFLLGSVTAKVLHDANCPVWTGPHLETTPNLESIHFRRVLCAIDLASGSPAVLEWAEDFARSHGAGLAVLHVLPGSLIQLGGVYFDPEWRIEAARTARKQIERLRSGHEIETDVMIEFGEASAGVADLARRWQADLLVIGRGAAAGMLGRLRATAYAILRESPCPVVAV
jgi:nucleotide-binding universal stress UspA family protein